MARTLHVDDAAVIAAIKRLPPEVAAGPPERSFLKHLLCTWRILKDWGMPVAVCRAGFLHSVYSTSFYPHALFGLDQRDVVRSMIGNEAEELVFRFCTMDRRGFWDELALHPPERRLTYPDRLRDGAPVRAPRRTLERLLMIESANLAEQVRAADFGPAPWMSRVFRWWEFLEEGSIPLRLDARPALSASADARAVERYRNALHAPLKRATALLDHAIRENPWAAEPKILRALCAAQQDDGQAVVYVHQGMQRLRAWATPWDKRLTVKGWTALAERIEYGSGRAQQLNFEAIAAVLQKRARMPRWLAV